MAVNEIRAANNIPLCLFPASSHPSGQRKTPTPATAKVWDGIRAPERRRSGTGGVFPDIQLHVPPSPPSGDEATGNSRGITHQSPYRNAG